jgi:hypothetical protein
MVNLAKQDKLKLPMHSTNLTPRPRSPESMWSCTWMNCKSSRWTSTLGEIDLLQWDMMLCISNKMAAELNNLRSLPMSSWSAQNYANKQPTWEALSTTPSTVWLGWNARSASENTDSNNYISFFKDYSNVFLTVLIVNQS